jgi:hypothetical protein
MVLVRLFDSLIKLYLAIHLPIGLLLDSQSGDAQPSRSPCLVYSQPLWQFCRHSAYHAALL